MIDSEVNTRIAGVLLILVQELVLAIWLIVKGFDTPEIARYRPDSGAVPD